MINEVFEPVPRVENFSDEEVDFDLLEQQLFKISEQAVNTRKTSYCLEDAESGFHTITSKWRTKNKEKIVRATSNVLNEGTRTLLNKLLKDSSITSMHGVISTGKEAVVYHAIAGEEHKAVKIYRTTKTTFKNRETYMDDRDKKLVTHHNRRDLIKKWAEKEGKNLERIRKGGIACPVADYVNDNILVMEFIGEDGVPAPLLKDARLTASEYRELYLECVLIVRKLYLGCKLVHGDLSEYNLLYHDGGIVVIDVSQAVDEYHPNAVEFLRRDCDNVNNFFSKKKVRVPSLRELFDFVTDDTIDDENIDDEVDKLMRNAVESEKRYDPNALNKDVITNRFVHSTLHDEEHAENLGKKNKNKKNKKKVISTKKMTKEQMKAHKKKVKEENRERRNNTQPKKHK